MAEADPVEVALAGALEAATREERWDVVVRLADELRARREARAANVVPFAKARNAR